MNTTNTPQPLSRRVYVVTLAVLIALAGGLALDLANQGAVWWFFWSKTGEEAPLAQIRGIVEWAGYAIRPPLETAPDVPIDHVDVVPYGINTFLQKEVEAEKLDVQLQMISEAGFVWLRQEFPWEDLEVDGRGQFTDTRNDIDGDGQLDTIDAWEKYDRIVDRVEQYDLRLIVRLSNPPAWSRAETAPTLAGALAPPDDVTDFVNYAAAVAERYQGRIHYYQVWNEPNIYPEWGENFVDAVAYTEMLCRTYDALKAIDPEIIVLSGALAPTNAIDGRNISDHIFLQNMYDNGAANCFDIMSVQGYGLFSGPTDQRTRFNSANYGRNVMIRDIMVKNGDAHKPIWLSEAAWNPVLSAERPREEIADFERFGVVTNEQAARYMPIAYQRAQEDWPWVGVVNYWFFTRPTPFESDQSFYYFRMVEPDYSPEKPTFTPLPVYTAVKDYIQNQSPILYPGVHQAETWQITRPDWNQVNPVPHAQFEDAVLTDDLTFQVQGTDLLIRWMGQLRGTTVFTANGETLDFQRNFPMAMLSRDTVASDWQWMHLSLSATSETHTIRIIGETPIYIDSITVSDRSYEKLAPIVGPALVVGLFSLWVILSALWKRVRS